MRPEGVHPWRHQVCRWVLIVVKSPFGLEVVEAALDRCGHLLLSIELSSRPLDLVIDACSLQSSSFG